MLDVLFNSPAGGIALLCGVVTCLFISPMLLVLLAGFVLTCWMIHALFGGY